MASKFEEVLSTLKECQSHENLLRALCFIENAVEDPHNITVLRENGYLKNLMRKLRIQQKCIIDISVNILATCTVDKEIATKAIKEYALLTQLHDLVNLNQNEENMNKMILKIVGNICKHSESWVVLILRKCPKFVGLALSLLELYSRRHVSEDSLIMALRFLRLLLYGPPNAPTIALATDFVSGRGTGVVTVVTHFFSNVILKRDINENILSHTINLLYTYSQCINWICKNRILVLCSSMPFFLKRIPRMMSKFIKIDQFNPHLSLDSNVYDWIIQNLKDLNIEDSKDEYVDNASCLCFLLMTKYKWDIEKFIPELLIKVLKFVENPSYADIECFILIVISLKLFVDYNIHVGDLMDCDIFSILIEKLKWVCGKKTFTSDFIHQIHEGDVQEMSESQFILGRCNHPNPRFQEDYSASSINDGGKVYTKGEFGCPCTGKGVIDEMKKSLYKVILAFFHSYTNSRYTRPELASEEFVTALVISSVHFGQGQFLYIYDVCEMDHLIHLLCTDVMEKIYDMEQRQFQHNSSCAECKNIKDFGYNNLEGLKRIVVEFSYKSMMINEDITKALETGRTEQKVRLILNLSNILEKQFSSGQLLLEFDRVNSLPQLIRDGSPLKRRIIKFLHLFTSKSLKTADSIHVYIALAPKRLEITVPTQADTSKPSQISKSALIKTAAAKQRLVTFKLDDGSTVQADRYLLANKSWYFSKLLEGYYRESREEEVVLSDTPVNNLKFMLHLLEDSENIAQLVMEHDLEFLFDELVFLDRYGLFHLCSLLISCISKYRMNLKTMAAIYRWSIQLNLELLRMDAVMFALVHCCEENERVVLFESVFDMGCRKELIEDIETIIEGTSRQ